MTWIPILGAIITLIGAGLLAVVGLIGAGLSFYFYWKTRTTPYKEILYSKQLDGYLELSDIIEQILIHLEFKVQNPLEIGKELEDYRETLKKFKKTYISKLTKWSIILPKTLGNSYMKFIIDLNINKIVPKTILDIFIL